MSDDLTFTAQGIEPQILEEVRITMLDLDEEHILPAVKHPHYDAVTSLYAVVIKLHQRVQVLEEQIKLKVDSE